MSEAPAPGAGDRALTWVEGRLGDVHPELAEAVRRCVGEVRETASATSVAEALADAASAELEAVARGPQDRAAAVRLLAADAVLTYAFEAVAEEGGDPSALAERVGPRGTLGRALADAARTTGEAG